MRTKSIAKKGLSAFGLFVLFALASCGNKGGAQAIPDEDDRVTGEDPNGATEEGNADGEDPIVEEPVTEEPEPIESVYMQAAKHYRPSQWEDDEVILNGEVFSFVIPDQLEVISGNGGNHWSKLIFDGVECRYKGGSSQSKPLKGGDETQIELGQFYHFQHCLDESAQQLDLVSGDVITASESLLLGVENGDSAESTIISVTVDVAE